MTATTALTAARAQLARVFAALDARKQQQRGHDSHVPIPTDDELRAIVVGAIGLLGGGK